MISKFNISWQIICIFSKSHLLTVVKSFIFLSSNVMSLIALTNINQFTSHNLFLSSCGISIAKWISEPQVIVTFMFSKTVSMCLSVCFVGFICIGFLVWFILFWFSFETGTRRQLTTLGQVWSVSCDVNVASSFTFLYSKKKSPYVFYKIILEWIQLTHEVSIWLCGGLGSDLILTMKY